MKLERITLRLPVQKFPAVTVVSQIPMGQGFLGHVGGVIEGSKPRLFLRIYDGVVLLEKPSSTWGESTSVYDYTPVPLTITAEIP